MSDNITTTINKNLSLQSTISSPSVISASTVTVDTTQDAQINESELLQSNISAPSITNALTFYEGAGTIGALTDVNLEEVVDGSILIYDTNEFVARTLSGDATIDVDGVLTLTPNSVTLGTDTSGNYVSTIIGTTNQVNVLGSGSEGAEITLSLPQNISTNSSPTFNNITINGIISNTNLSDTLDLKAPLNSPNFTGTVSGITAAMVGLDNVDNTSDNDKPISNATSIALNSKVDKVIGQGLSDQNYTLIEKNKLAGIAIGATSNFTNEYLLDRAHHTGTQSYTTISGLGTLATQDGTFSGTSTGVNTGDQTIVLSGDAIGTGNTSIDVTLANSGVSPGTYGGTATTNRTFTVDSKGRITDIGEITTITPSFSSIANTPTTLSGYGITDAALEDHTHPNATITSDGFLSSSDKIKIDSALQSVDVNYIGVYDNGYDYILDDVVLWPIDNQLYKRIGESNVGYPPGTEYWELFEPQIGSPAYDLWIENSFNNKVDKVVGKTLSDQNYTLEEKNKLNGIEIGAEVNVNADWNATSGDANILNKPTTLSGYGITDAVNINTSQTIGGVKTFTDNVICNGTSNLFVNEAGFSPHSLLTQQQLMLGGHKFRQLVYITGSTSASTSSNSSAFQVFGLLILIGNFNSAYAKANILDGLYCTSGSISPLSINVELDLFLHGVALQFQPNSYWVARINFGVASGNPSIPANLPVSTGNKQWGIEMYYNEVDQKYYGRLYYYITSLIYGDPFELPLYLDSNYLSWQGFIYSIRMRQVPIVGNRVRYEFYINSSESNVGGTALSKTTPTAFLETTTPAPPPGRYSGKHITIEVASDSSFLPNGSVRMQCNTMYCQYR